MSMIKKFSAVVTTVDIGTPFATLTTPFAGGDGRKAILRLDNKPITSTVKLQGAPKDPGTKEVPAEDSTAWADIVTLTSASDTIQEIALPEYLRWNCTVLDADGPDIVMYLEGVQ